MAPGRSGGATAATTNRDAALPVAARQGRGLPQLALVAALAAVGLAVAALWAGGPGSGAQQCSRLLEGLRSQRDAATPRRREARVVLGFNVCVDAVVDALGLLEALGLSPPQSESEWGDHAAVGSLAELRAVFALHLSRAAGGERAVTSAAAFGEIERALERVPHVSKLGGNAAIMAQVLAEDWGFEHVLVGGQVGPVARRLLPAGVTSVGLPSGAHELGGASIAVRQDELHVIMEYERGAAWGVGTGRATAQRANRFIVSRDLSNAAMASMEPLGERVAAQRADIMVASGLHMLDGMDAGFRRARLAAAARHFDAVPRATRLHFELAGVGDPQLLRAILDAALPRVDSLGLNEQELAATARALALAAPRVCDEIAATVPPPVAVAAALEALLRRAAAEARQASAGADAGSLRAGRSLTRVHFHSFAFHIIAQTAAGDAAWPHAASAVAAGSVKASERACNSTLLQGHDLTLHLAQLALPNGTVATLTGEAPVVEWRTDDNLVRFVLAPVLACNRVVQTVGLGDSISASAIAYQA
jgi:ADP-dependent glucokinase